MGVSLRFTFHGFNELATRLNAVAREFEERTFGAWFYVRDNINADIKRIFETLAAGEKYPWADLAKYTWDARAHGWGYYGEVASLKGDLPGHWGGWLEQALATQSGERAAVMNKQNAGMGPGVVFNIQNREMSMGITKGPDYKYTFLTGNPRNRQPERPVYENLHLDEDGSANPIVRGFEEWLIKDVGINNI